jgi:hypothetical protein
MTATEARQAPWEVTSAGASLHVSGPSLLATWWPIIAPHLPMASIREGTADRAVDAVIPAGASPADVRRWLNAHLHCLHLGRDVLALHAVALERDGGVILLLGDHGAGKSLTGLAMVRAGWRVVAGDVALVRMVRPRRAGEAVVHVLGGTNAYLVNRDAVSCCFPGIGLPDNDQEKIDLSDRLSIFEGGELDRSWGGWPLVHAAMVHAFCERSCSRRASVTNADSHTAASILYRASGHLLNRVPLVGHDPLGLLETPDQARRRLRLVRELAATVRVQTVTGPPTAIEAVIRDVG